MSEFQIDPRAELTSPAAEAELPIVESPPLSPAMAALAAIEIEPGPMDAPEIKPTEPAEAIDPAPSATQRFRTEAATQIAAARERLDQRMGASMVALALVASLAGGLGTVLATGAIAHLSAPDARIAQIAAMTDAIARMEDDLAALRGKVERTAELTVTREEETSARIERVEKAQAEPAAKLAKLGEAIDKLRNAHATMMAQAATAANADVTGSIKSPASAPKKPAIVEGWTLKEVDRDAALIEGKRGLFETYVGDTIPGVGRVEGFRKQDGQWVIVTAKGLIVSKP